MRRIVAGLAITLDGVVEAPSGNWMRMNDELAAIMTEGLARADAVLLGRRTYLEFARIWPGVPRDVGMSAFLNGSPKYVASRTLTEADIAAAGWGDTTLVDFAGIEALKAAPGGDIQVPGSPRLVRELLYAGLLDELTLAVHPIVLGRGQRMFGDGDRLDLTLTGAKELATGVVLTTYTR